MTQKESRSHLYMIWSSMKRRCENPNMPNYKYFSFFLSGLACGLAITSLIRKGL